jgi:hypothetical protein
MFLVEQDNNVINIEEEEEEVVSEEAVNARDRVETQLFKRYSEIPIPEKRGLFESI